MGSLGLFLQCATSTVFSLLMSRLVRHFGSRRVYLSSMVSFTISALVICMSKSVVLVTVMSALTGFAYATLQTLPYTLTCHYHKEMEVRTERHTYIQYSVGPVLPEHSVHMKSYFNCDTILLTPLDAVGVNSHVSGLSKQPCMFQYKQTLTSWS